MERTHRFLPRVQKLAKTDISSQSYDSLKFLLRAQDDSANGKCFNFRRAQHICLESLAE